MSFLIRIIIIFLFILIEGAVDTAIAAPLKKGDVFAAVANGRVQHYDADLNFIETLNTGKGGYTTGMAFDKDGNLYVTNFSANSVSVFSATEGTLLGTFGTGYNASPESIVFDAVGNAYIGHGGGDFKVRKFDSHGYFLEAFSPSREFNGTDWIDLAADQKTLFYTSEGKTIRRFDLSTKTQLSNFTDALHGASFALRILLDGGVLVADTRDIHRLDATGVIVQTYDAPGENCWFALNLDPDGTSFWSGDYCTSNFYKFDIASGAVLATKNTGTGVSTLYGLSVSGEITAARPSDFNSVRVIDTISTANIDLDATSFSKQPASITQDTQNNLTIIEWQYDSFTIGLLEKLNFDVILKNPIPGEDRLVNHKLELIYTDAAGNTIRKELGQQHVHVQSSNFNITPATDKPEYNANEQGTVNLAITNIGDMARTVDIHINMVDYLGNMASQIALITNTIFAAGQTITFPNITFNTGNTFSGPYQIQATLYEQTKPVGQGKTSVTIKSPLPQSGITSGISTNKAAYTAYEPVRISSVVTSKAVNYIYTNLDIKVKITNSNGQQITELMRSIPTLLPSARNEGILYFDTGANPPGTYNITQQVYRGTELVGQSAANLTILSTEQTGAGITGQITPMPKSLYRWQELTLNYNISNIGNANLPDIGLKILIIDPETGAAQITLTDNISPLTMGSSITRIKTIPSPDLPVTRQSKDYMIILQGVLPSGAKTLASASISVMPPIKVTKEITGKPRALIWLCKDEDNPPSPHFSKRGMEGFSGEDNCKEGPDPLEPIIKEALRQLNITYYLIVYNKKDYQRYLRSNEFNTYLVFNNHAPIEDHLDEELTEHINAGKGIIAFFIKKEEEHGHSSNNEKELPVFGVRFKGYLPDEQRILYLTDTEITDADTITTSGKVEKTEATDLNAKIIASYNDGIPAIITNNYGLGKAILYTFDLRGTTQTAAAGQIANLIKKAINYTAPTKEGAYISGGVIPVTITIQNLGMPTILKIEEMLQPNTPATSDTAQRTGDRLYWEINLTTGEARKLTYYMIASETPAIALITNTYYLEQNNLWQLYDQTELKINIKTNTAEITAHIIEKLNSLTITDRKLDEERAEIIKILTELQNLTIQKGTKEADEKLKEAISKALKAIEGLNEIRQELQKANILDQSTEKTINDICYELDQLLMLIEIWWYLYAEGAVIR